MRTTIAARCAQIAALLFLGLASLGSRAGDLIEDMPYPVDETPFEQNENWGGLGLLWLDQDRLLFNTYQEVPDARKKNLRRVILYNVRTHAATTLIPSGSFYCLNADTSIAAVNVNGVDRHVTINLQSGEMSALETPAPYRAKGCRRSDPAGFMNLLLRAKDGYIDRDNSGSEYRPGDAPILRRPGQPPLELPLTNSEVQFAIYIPFLDKYLLNISDSRRLQQGDMPYRLMSPDGQISEIPYPARLGDYLNGSRKMYFGRAFVLRTGLLVTETGKPPGRGEFLLIKGERVLRIWSNNGGFVNRIESSPDGCKIVFTSFWRQRIFLFVPETSNTLKIIDVCKDN